jgi:hypothetical protein
MLHEPSDSCLPIQPTADRRCSSCRAVKPLDDFPTRVDARPPAVAGPAGAAALRSPVATGSGPCASSRAAPRPATAPCSPSTPRRGGGGDAA